MSKPANLKLTGPQATVVLEALLHYFNDFLTQSPYNNLTAQEQGRKRAVTWRIIQQLHKD